MEKTTEEGPRAQKSKRKFLIFGAITLALVVAIGVFLATRTATQPAALNKANQDFTVLYGSNLPRGLIVNTSAVTYENGVLFIPITSEDGRSISITQQPLPEKFKQSNDLVGAEKVTGADGPAAVSHVQGHTTATMMSNDRKTLVIINDSSNVGTDTVKDLLRSLRPLNR